MRAATFLIEFHFHFFATPASPSLRFLLLLLFPKNLFSKVFTHVDGGATYVDSDTGLESMSSAEATTKACSLCLDGVVASNNMMVPPEANMQIEGLKQEVTRLKCDKLDLLRQNVVSTAKDKNKKRDWLSRRWIFTRFICRTPARDARKKKLNVF